MKNSKTVISKGGGGRGRKKMEREREDKSLATQYGFVYLNASSKVPGCS